MVRRRGAWPRRPRIAAGRCPRRRRPAPARRVRVTPLSSSQAGVIAAAKGLDELVELSDLLTAFGVLIRRRMQSARSSNALRPASQACSASTRPVCVPSGRPGPGQISSRCGASIDWVDCPRCGVPCGLARKVPPNSGSLDGSKDSRSDWGLAALAVDRHYPQPPFLVIIRFPARTVPNNDAASGRGSR